MMTCPVCGGEVEVNKSYSDCETVARKRKCVECGYVFYTEEVETDEKCFRDLEQIHNKKRCPKQKRTRGKTPR